MSADLEGFEVEIVNCALVAYVGRGERRERPGRYAGAVRSLADAGREEELLALVERLNEVADSISADTSEVVDFSVTPAFTRKIRAHYPWIDDQAAEALSWASRYRRLFE